MARCSRAIWADEQRYRRVAGFGCPAIADPIADMEVAIPAYAAPNSIARDWIIAPPHAERDHLVRDARIAPLLAQVLLNRGISSAAAMHGFLAPDFKELLPPERLPNAVAVGRRLADAARERTRVVIYGDYDVDGITATTILYHGLKLAGACVDYYIPSRFDEGYGLNTEALEAIAADGGQLVITVDCGITAIEQADRARKLGLGLIITDHHEPRGSLPDADFIVHPAAGAEKCPNPDLCGAGVAFKVAWALAQAVCGGGRVTPAYREYLLDATAFAALGLVADVVPLTGENRIIASYGLRQLRHTQNVGLRALLEVSGLTGKKSYDDYDVGFLLGPRLNALGRMGHAAAAVELFTRADAGRARQIATDLDARNRQRQSVERQIVKQAEALVLERGYNRESCRGIVLASDEWHAGVIGIVASRLVERFGRPTVLIALENGRGQGSGRSIRHFPLHEVLQACDEHLSGHGGHAMAAGVRIEAEKIDAFTAAFQNEANRRLTAADLRPKLHLDDEVALEQLTTDVIEAMQRMAPFGPGNPRPRLATGVVEVADPPRVVGRDGRHLQLTVRQGRTYRKAIAFGRGQYAEELTERPRLRVAFEPIINEWNDRRSVELKVLDWKCAD